MYFLRDLAYQSRPGPRDWLHHHCRNCPKSQILLALKNKVMAAELYHRNVMFGRVYITRENGPHKQEISPFPHIH